MRILVIEDDPAAAKAVESILAGEKMIVTLTDLGEDGVDLAKLYGYDAILLDLELPDMHGFDVLRAIRAARIDTPVLICSSRGGADLKVKGLGIGADDYITKPFNGEELVARINALVRRAAGHTQSAITIGPLTIDINQKVVTTADGTRIPFTAKEYAMVELLALRKGMTITKEAFLLHLYGEMDEPEIKIVDVFICKVRKKLAAATGDPCIETIWGRGYVLREPAKVPPEKVAA